MPITYYLQKGLKRGLKCKKCKFASQDMKNVGVFRLEPSEMETSNRCAQCSYQALWSFQLDHHNQKSHGYGHTSELFDVMAEMELYPCAYCDFKTYLKLVRYEHCMTEHDSRNNEDGGIKRAAFGGFERNFCRHCEYEGHSSLSFVKHDDSCGIIRKDPLANAYLLADSTADSKNAIGNRHSSIYINSVDGCQPDQLWYKSKTESILDKRSVEHIAADSDRWFCCSKCSYCSKVERNLRRHNIRVHVGCDEIKWFDCGTCSYRAKRKDYLQKHIIITHAERDIVWFDCAKCSYRAKFKESLKRHMLVHARPEQINWFSCTGCCYRSKRKHDLKSHMVIHTGTSWFSCSECSFRSKLKKSLKQHSLMHETNVFCCSQCSYGTKRKGDLKSHMLVHATSDEIKWKACPKCAYRAKHTGNLKTHMMTHVDPDEIDWLNCTKCSYRAKVNKNLIMHMSRHHAESPKKLKNIDCTLPGELPGVGS